jgi:uncharacterized protein YcaQ
VTTNSGAAISAAEARALALRAQGFGATRAAHPGGAGAAETPGDPLDVLSRLGVLQLDAVSVLARPQELVPFSRVGAFSPAALAAAVYEHRRGFEYWGHEASWLPMAEYRYFLPRMAHYRAHAPFVAHRREHAADYERVLSRLRAEGPLTAQAFAEPRPQRRAAGGLRTLGLGGNWWERQPAKRVLEILFAGGEVMAAGRTAAFARQYDLPERVLPPAIDTADPGPSEAARYLMKRAIGALGVATGKDAAFYYQLAPQEWRSALASLEAAGEVVRLRVEGWSGPGYALPSALDGSLSVPAHRPVFLSPFDNLIWERARTERLFGFFYRIEIYVPEPKRRYGYYVLPLLVDGALAGRADLKLDRRAGVLRVRAMYLEGTSAEEVTAAAAGALHDLAAHLSAARIDVERTEPAGALRGLQALV